VDEEEKCVQSCGTSAAVPDKKQGIISAIHNLEKNSKTYCRWHWVERKMPAFLIVSQGGGRVPIPTIGVPCGWEKVERSPSLFYIWPAEEGLGIGRDRPVYRTPVGGKKMQRCLLFYGFLLLRYFPGRGRGWRNKPLTFSGRKTTLLLGKKILLTSIIASRAHWQPYHSEKGGKGTH